MKKKFSLFLILLGLLTLAMACRGDIPSEYRSENSFRTQEQLLTEKYQRKLTSAVPYPLSQMTDSLERRQLREKLLRFNDPSKIGYVVTMTDLGQIVNYYTIKGKVSNTNSMMTTLDQLECLDWNGGQVDGCIRVNSPGDDGSYGPNEDGVFFFTTEGVMIVWNGLYQYSDYPVIMNVEPLIIYDASNAEPSSSFDIGSEGSKEKKDK